MLDEEFQPELPPPPARGPRHIQGEIRLPEDMREEILQADRMQPTLEVLLEDVGAQNVSSELSEDIGPTQPVEMSSPTTVADGAPVISTNWGGVHDFLQSEDETPERPTPGTEQSCKAWTSLETGLSDWRSLRHGAQLACTRSFETSVLQITHPPQAHLA